MSGAILVKDGREAEVERYPTNASPTKGCSSVKRSKTLGSDSYVHDQFC